MLTAVSRMVGFVVCITLMAIGANTVLDTLTKWKQSHTRRG